jgi:hypothetical protein
MATHSLPHAPLRQQPLRSGAGAARSAGLPARPPVRTSPAGPLRDVLLNACLMAAARGMEEESVAIQTVLVGLGVDALGLHVALAIIELRAGDVPGCLRRLEHHVLAHDAGHELALAVQADAWRRQGRPEWRMQAQALLATSADPMVRSVVREHV